MENKREKSKRCLTTEFLEQRKGRRDCRDDSGYYNKRNQTTGVSRTEQKRPGHLLGHASTSAERSGRTSVEALRELCAGTKIFPAGGISRWRTGTGTFTVSLSAVFWNGRLWPDKVWKTLRWLTEECVRHIDWTLGV